MYIWENGLAFTLLEWWDECGGDEYNTWPTVTSVVNTNYFGVDDADDDD